MNKYDIDQEVEYIGSDDEWNHECCKGALYKITRIYPPVWGIYYYDMVTISKSHDIFKDENYPKLSSVREYQITSIDEITGVPI